MPAVIFLPHSALAVCLKVKPSHTLPCHRVVYSDGRLGGYGGMKRMRGKARILTKDGVKVEKGRIFDFEKRYFKINP
ncbi:MAG: MGMT family protein [Thaumarchaeota archaeon]|nr:MGMT family protein [Nitrososphaerota archaeon]